MRKRAAWRSGYPFLQLESDLFRLPEVRKCGLVLANLLESDSEAIVSRSVLWLLRDRRLVVLDGFRIMTAARVDGGEVEVSAGVLVVDLDGAPEVEDGTVEITRRAQRSREVVFREREILFLRQRGAV